MATRPFPQPRMKSACWRCRTVLAEPYSFVPSAIQVVTASTFKSLPPRKGWPIHRLGQLFATTAAIGSFSSEKMASQLWSIPPADGNLLPFRQVHGDRGAAEQFVSMSVKRLRHQ